MTEFPPIHRSTERGEFPKVQEIIEADPSQVHAKSKDDDQPLHIAAWQSKTKIGKLLIEKGADVNAIGNGGRTPLHYALENEAKQLIKVLLEAGADPSLKDELGVPPIYLAAYTKDTRTANLLIKHGAVKDLIASVYLDKPKKVLKTLKANPELLEQVKNKANLLTDAIFAKSVEMVEILLDNGVSPNAISWYKSPPLFQAIGFHPDEKVFAIIKLLIDHGADIDAKDELGETLLEFCTQSRLSQKTIDFLRGCGVKK